MLHISVKRIPENSMWSKKASVYGRSLGSLRSAQHKYARRCNHEKMIQVSLEIAYSKCPKAAFDYMSTILVEDKFPDGGNFVYQHQMISKQFKKMTKDQQLRHITQMAYTLATIPSDRHPCNLARVALDLAKDNTSPHDPELKMAYEVEQIILRMKRKKEMPSSEDITVENGMKMIKSIVFAKIPFTKYNLMLFDIFKKNWVQDYKGTDRLYIYNLVGRNFHLHKKFPQYVPSITVPALKKVELDDYVFDQHTYEGRKRKRGVEHFLKEGAHLENTSENYAERGGIKRKAASIFAEDAKIHGRNSGSHQARKRIRDSFNELVSLKGMPIVSISMCAKPSLNKPKKMRVEIHNGSFFVKGPFKELKEIEFQEYIDKKKSMYGLKSMQMETICEDGLYYLICPWQEGFETMTMRFYSNEILWNVLRVLVFRAVFDVKKTTLNKIMVNMATNEVISIGEMSAKRMRPRAEGIIHRLFSKVPNEMMCKQLNTLIHQDFDRFRQMVSEFGKEAELIFL